MKIPTKKEKGFTLAETLITLTILGVVAAITVPSLINKYTETSNRTKVKKAMAAYEKALNQMVIDNDIKGAISAAEGFRTTDNCSGSSPYFKAIKYAQKNNADNLCRFQTSDRVWWDITDIEHPIIALNEEDLDNTNAEKRFVLVGHLEDGILRINDSGFETTDPNKTYLTKLYNFINNTEGTSGSGTGGGTTEKCKLKTGSTTKYECTGSELTWTKATIGAASETNSDFCVWNGTTCTPYEDNTSKVSANDIFISDIFQTTSAEGYAACSDHDSRIVQKYGEDICNYEIGGDHWFAAKKNCEQNGSHLATLAELKALDSVGALENGHYWSNENSSFNASIPYSYHTGSGNIENSSYGMLKFVCVSD